MSSVSDVGGEYPVVGLGDVMRIAAQPASIVVGAAQGAFKAAMNAVVPSLSGSGVPSGVTDAMVDYNQLLQTQNLVQIQMQQVSMQSNLEKSRHETSMAPIRNIRVG